MGKPYRVAEERVKWVEWLTAINEDSDGLTKWEENFVNSLTERLERQSETHFSISDREAEILERIYTEKTP